MKKLIILSSLFCLLSLPCYSFADISRLRIIGLGGLGSAAISTEGNSDSIESPLAFSASIDYLMNSQINLGAEHMRTLGTNGTAVGLTGLSAKYYFWFQHPQTMLNSISFDDRPSLQIQAVTPFIGASLGFAQASVLNTTINTVSIYLNLKVGIDYPLTTIWGFRFEGNTAFSTVGTGRIRLYNAMLGFYFYL